MPFGNKEYLGPALSDSQITIFFHFLVSFFDVPYLTKKNIETFHDGFAKAGPNFHGSNASMNQGIYISVHFNKLQVGW